MKQQSMSLRTTLENFLNHAETLEAKKAEGEDLYEKEFQLLKTLSESLRCLPQYSCSYGERDMNRRKNRYKDILPYDYTRVSLSEIPGVPGSDYVNANYIKGASGSLAYIASQGPLPHTVEDFWRMIWECEVQIVVMASSEMEGGKHKCERYWPYEGEERSFGNITVVLLRLKQVCPDFLVRTMKASSSEEERTIIQFHYVSWPDHGIPDAVGPILNMTKLVRDCQSSETLPVLVHCSAGCGRTGTICAIDYVLGLLRAGKLTEDFSLFQLIAEMRKQRIAMVQTKEQYILVHRAVKELFEQHLKVMDSHHYENVDFSGCPMIKNDVDYEFIDVEDPDAKSIDKTSDGNTQNSDTDVSEDMLCSADRLGVCDRSRKVPPLPRKRRTTLPPPNPMGSDSDSCESQVRLLISTWNHGKPLPVDQSTLIDNDTVIDDENLSTADEQIHNSEETEKELDPQHYPIEVIIKDDVLPADKAVVIRKPSIAKLRAIFEKNSDSGSPTSDNTEVPFARRTKHKKKDKMIPPGGAESSESSLQNEPSKRSRSPFKSMGSDNPEMQTVSTRYKDTALKVYSEFKQREGGQSEDGITPSESSPNSIRTEKSPPPERRPSPTVPEFLRRVGSRRGTTSANRTTSVWYDQSNAGEECKAEHNSKSEDKPALPIKRSKSMKVQSITENAFGLFRLPSPIRQRKVAAYLGVEDKKSSKESSPVPEASIPASADLPEALEVFSKSAELTTDGMELKPGSPPTADSNSGVSPDKSDSRPVDNLLPSPKYFRRFYSRSVSQPDKDHTDSLPPKEKPKLHYFFGDRQPDVVAGSGLQQPVQLIRVRSKSDDAPYCQQAHPDVVPNKNTITPETTFHHSSSVTQSAATPTLGEGTVASDSSFKIESPVLNKTITSPLSVLNQVPLATNETPPSASQTKEFSQGVSSVAHHKYVNVVLAQDIPPPLPAKKNSPAGSPLVRRQTKGTVTPEDPQKKISPSVSTQVPLTEVPDSSPSSPRNKVPEDTQINEARPHIEVQVPVLSALSAALEQNKPAELTIDTVVPLPGKTPEAVPFILLAERLAASNELASDGNGPQSSSIAEDDESYQQIIRDCQEYLLSSGYSNIFPEMSRNLMLIEQSLEKHPRGGFVDLLSSIDSLTTDKIESKSDLRFEVDKTSSCTENKETDTTPFNLNEDPNKKALGSLTKEHMTEASAVDGSHSDICVNNMQSLSPGSDVGSQAKDYSLHEEKCSNNDMQLSKPICLSDNAPAHSREIDSSPKTLVHSSKVPAEAQLELPFPATSPTSETSLNPDLRPEYEHLWLSQSGDLPALATENSEHDPKKDSEEGQEKSCCIYKTPPLGLKDKAASPVKDLRTTCLRRGSCDGSSEKDLATAFVNKERASSTSPQLSRIPVRCKRATSKSKDKENILDRKYTSVTSLKSNEVGDTCMPTKSISNQDECEDVFGGLSSPKLLKELSFQSFTEKTEGSGTVPEWQLNSCKMVRNAMSSTSPMEEQLPKLTTSTPNRHHTLGHGDRSDTPLNRAIEEMETLAEIMEKKDLHRSRESIAKEKLEPPMKPARNLVDGRPRKPQPLPRSILPGKFDSPVKILATVPAQEIHIPIHSLERKKRKDSFSSTAPSCRVTPSDKSVKQVQTATCEDHLLLKGNIKCAVKSDENAFIYRPKRERIVSLGLQSPSTHDAGKKISNNNKLNHKYEELDLNASLHTPEKKKVENEYEEIFFRGAEPSQEKLIDIAKRASSIKGVASHPPRARRRSEETSETSPSDEEKRKSSDSAVVKCTLLLPVAGKVEIQCTPEQTDPTSPSSHVYETVGGSLQRRGRPPDGKGTMIPKYTVVSSSAGLEERRPTVRKRSASLKRKEATRKASLDAMGINDRALSSYLKTHQHDNDSTYSQLCKNKQATESQDVLYSEVSKERSNSTQPYRRCFVDSPTSQRSAGRKARYSKDDLELCPVVPPRLKRQSSASLRRNTVMDSNAGAEDAFWWTHTLPGRLNNPLLAMQASKWGEDWDSDDDCQPPVPAKTREAYMLPQPDTSSSGSSTVTPTEVNSPGHGQDHPLGSKTKAHTKFNLLSRFGLKSEVKGSEEKVTTPVIRPVRSTALQQSIPRPTAHGAPGFGFPHRLPKKPQGPRDPPSNWTISTLNRST